MTSKVDIQRLLKERGIRPKKGLGQNFLISQNVLKKIIAASQLCPQDTVLEIGPGLGILTKELAQQVKKVIACEKDSDIMEILKQEMNRQGIDNVKFIRADILKIFNTAARPAPSAPSVPSARPAPSAPSVPATTSALSASSAPSASEASEDDSYSEFQRLLIKDQRSPGQSYKLISNLPYNIATEVIRMFLERVNPPKLMILMIQKEVGEKICNKRGRGARKASNRFGKPVCPGKMSRLGILCQFYGKAEIVASISKRCFWPQPKVDSVIIKIIPYKTRTSHYLCEQFAKIVKTGFSHPRKQLVGNLKRGLGISLEQVKAWLSENNIQPNQRAESLELKDWINLAKSYKILMDTKEKSQFT